jgi:hypothetical protein
MLTIVHGDPNSIVPSLGDKTKLTWDVAYLRERYTDDLLESDDTYNEAIKVLTDPAATQSSINSIRAKLSNVDFSKVKEEQSTQQDTVGSTYTFTMEV